ncbi:hypothetical protein sce2159 [Sorangium cellulosum So ce56]|uniref:Uncharacterized protein n=1 Tax=Sorangium cellulosum (strain So ce56) TaxID=448385 RepID=A9FVW3_SORC5|nr:hypothetical protein sce2159 [Sorangium cellulosum So ce56]
MAEMLDDVGARVIEHGACIPARTTEQVLQRVRRRVAGRLGELPAVFVLSSVGGRRRRKQRAHPTVAQPEPSPEEVHRPAPPARRKPRDYEALGVI